MKTRVTKISNLILSLSFCLALQSCNKEDFYEKEFLDNPFQDNPVAGGTIDDGRINGPSDGTTAGSSTGGTDGSVTGGSSTGGTDGSVTGGSSTGGTDGSVTGGSSTGGTDGSVTGGSSTGGTDGSVTGGTSGQTPGASGDDCNIGQSLETNCKMESFLQAQKQTKKLDILWIIDNSGSMADEQTALGSNFSAFIDEFIMKDVDFKMAITTTDASTSYMKGMIVSGSDTKLTSARAKLDETQFKTDFRNLVRVGTSGSGYEKGLEASEGFMQKYAGKFVRPDAYLAVVVLSDEEDQSAKEVKFYTDYLKSFKSEAGLVKVYTIADINKTNSGYGISTGADRYIKASDETAGVVASIRDHFYRSLSAMGDSIINLLDSFALANDPVAGTLKVYVNNVETQDYTFDAASRSIKFNSNRLPAVGAEIKVYYIKQ